MDLRETIGPHTACANESASATRNEVTKLEELVERLEKRIETVLVSLPMCDTKNPEPQLSHLGTRIRAINRKIEALLATIDL